MNLASSAYPNSALSAVTLTVIALVTVGTLALWLILVFRAASTTGKRAARPQASLIRMVTAPEQTAEDEDSGTDRGHAPQPGKAAA